MLVDHYSMYIVVSVVWDLVVKPMLVYSYQLLCCQNRFGGLSDWDSVRKRCYLRGDFGNGYCEQENMNVLRTGFKRGGRAMRE